VTKQAVVCLAGLLAACSRGPSDAQLTGWLEEARHEDDVQRQKGVTAETASWTLAVRGNVTAGAADYPWPKIVAIAKTHVTTSSPTHTSDVNKLLDYRGITIADLLDATGAQETDGPGGHDVSLVAADGYIGVRPIADIRRFPSMLAIEEDGVALVKKTGGPLLEVFPHTSHPESKKTNAEGGAYYVTTLIVGTEALSLTVGARTLKSPDLDALSERTVEGKTGFRFRWPSSAAKIVGPRLRDVLSAASITLHPGDRVLVRRKPHTDIAAREVTTLRAEDVLACDILVGVRYGERRASIPAGLGGPAVLAFPSACPDSAHGQPWPMFVEAIEVVPGSSDGGGGGR
jgi:hypothetical protein